MTVEDIFIKRLQEERKSRRWSQAELSRRVTALGHEIKKDAMSKIESGDRRVTLAEAVALAAALDTPLHALLLSHESEDRIALASKLTVRMPFAAAWLAGVMPLDRDDLEDYEGVGSDLFSMGLLGDLPELLSAKPNAHEIEMARAYGAKQTRTAELLEFAASQSGVSPRMADEMRDAARGRRDRAAHVESLLPKERKR